MLDRRTWCRAALGALAAPALAATSGTAPLMAAPTSAPRPLAKKAVKYGMVQSPGSMADRFRLLAELGFDGVELMAPNDYDLDEVLAARDASGLDIHGVVDAVHWKTTLTDPDPAVRSEAVAALEQALRTAKQYGATTVLLVPAVVNETVSYADAYQRSQAEIRKVLPLAAELQVKIALENVWNNFLLSPLETARYVDEFDSPWLGVYFDVGNVVTYGWPEQWIRTLGPRIVKLDIKEFSRAKSQNEGTRAGFGVELLEGDCGWPRVMDALREIGFSGWGTAEIPGGDRERLREIAARMDRIAAL